MNTSTFQSVARNVSRWLGHGQPGGGDYPAIGEYQRLYVIGDIHGRDDLLASMHGLIDADQTKTAEKLYAAAYSRRSLEVHEVYLGDYVDRGPDSAGVVQRLIQRAKDRELVLLRGNHEAMLQKVLAGEPDVESWLKYGGKETMASYVAPRQRPRKKADFKSQVDAFRQHFPMPHLQFLQSLRPYFRFSDYCFVHAGILPGLSVEQQDEEDLFWIREPFLSSTKDHGAIVVHGHTPSETADFRANRIGIDTGAYLSGRLTCLVISDEGVRVLTARK